MLARQQLTRGSSVAVVRVADQALVLGVTDGQVTLLAETDLATVEEYEPATSVRREAISLDGTRFRPHPQRHPSCRPRPATRRVASLE